MSKPKPAPLPSGTVVGGYRVIRKIAAGGFGVVYLAEDDQQRHVALKEYLPASLAERAEGELAPYVPPEKLPLYRLGLKSFLEEGRALGARAADVPPCFLHRTGLTLDAATQMRDDLMALRDRLRPR